MRPRSRYCGHAALLLVIGIASVSGAPLQVKTLTWAAAAALTPDQQTLVTGNGDGTVTALNPATGAVLQTWPAEGANQVEQLSFSADGRRVLAISPNRIARVLDLGSAQAASLARWSFPEYFPGGGLSPDGRSALLLGSGGVLRWCDVATGQVRREWRDSATVEGYSSAVVLDDTGLAFVAPAMHVGAALVDAARGEVLARITGMGGRPVEWIGPQQRLAWGGGLWSRDELKELRRTRPAGPQPPRTRDLSLGWIGQAMQRSLPPQQWNFWAPAGGKTEPAWLEPMWPQLRATFAPNRFRSPVVVDGRHRRIWWRDGDTWMAWDMSELGRPEALAGPSSGPRLRLIVDGTLQLTGGDNGATIVDPQRLIPKARLELPPRDSSGRSGPETPLGWMWDPQRGWLEPRFVRTQGQLQSIEVRTSGNRVTDRIPIQGMRSLPSIVPGPGDLWAINTYQPYQEPLGATSIGRSALRLWNCASHEWTHADFQDHLESGLLEIRWSQNGAWLGSDNFSDRTGPRLVRVWSAADGRRLAAPLDNIGNWTVGNDGSFAWTDRDGQVFFREADGQRVRRLHGPDASRRSAPLALSPDGRDLALLSNANELVVFSLFTAEIRHRSSLAWWPSHSPEADGQVIYLQNRQVAVVTTGESWLRVEKY